MSKLSGPLTKVAISLPKKVLASLGITAAASAVEARIQKKIHGFFFFFYEYDIHNKKMNNVKKNKLHTT